MLLSLVVVTWLAMIGWYHGLCLESLDLAAGVRGQLHFQPASAAHVVNEQWPEHMTPDMQACLASKQSLLPAADANCFISARVAVYYRSCSNDLGILSGRADLMWQILCHGTLVSGATPAEHIDHACA